MMVGRSHHSSHDARGWGTAGVALVCMERMRAHLHKVEPLGLRVMVAHFDVVPPSSYPKKHCLREKRWEKL